MGGNSNFTGSFDISAGTLAITGSTLSTNATTVAPGATLSLAGGTFGAESVHNAGTVSGYGTLAADLDSEGTLTGRGFATGTPGTLNVSGSAFFDSASTLKLRGGISSDLVAVAGDLTLAGTVQVSLAPGTAFGRYPLVTCGGTIELGSLALTGTTGHLSTSITGRVDLVIDDSDEDGLPDSWEQTHFGNLAQTPAGDKDGDGSSNLAEFRLNLNPASGGSAFRAVISGHTLTWPSAPGIVFTVKRSLSLERGSWQTVATVTGGAGTQSQFTDSTLNSKAFYQIEFTP